MSVEKKRRSLGEKERDFDVFYIRRRRRRRKGHVCYEMRDSSLFIEVFYR